MTTFTLNFPISIDNIISAIGILVTIAIAIVGGLYAIISNTKKYELTECYRKELLDWYKDTISIMIEIIHQIENGKFCEESFSGRKNELLSNLSAQIEMGRFYFPNIIKKDGYGKNKPSAYQGYRHIILEYLLHFYNISRKECQRGDVNTLWEMERRFTSVIFDTIEPRKRNKLYSKYTEIMIPEGMSIVDFLSENPENASIFLM